MATLSNNRLGMGLVCGVLGGLAVMPSLAQPVQTTETAPNPVQNLVQLSASAQREVAHDWLTTTLTTRAQGPDAAQVQRQISLTLQAALASARAQARSDLLEVTTGGFQVWPRYGKEGQVVGWQGSAVLVLQGRDATRITQLAGQLTGMAVTGVAWGLSAAAAHQLEAEVRQQAIAQFRQTAQQIAQGFGFAHYRLREVSVANDGHQVPVRPRPMVMAMEARTVAADVAVPTEPGKGVVQVTVSGSVQLH